MQITHKLAHTKWCPFVRVEGGSNRMLNTKTDGFETTGQSYHCLGRDCMAWREYHLEYEKSGVESYEPHGFCGLAGKPL